MGARMTFKVGTDFRGHDLRNYYFVEARLINCIFDGVDLCGKSFRRADLLGSTFTGTDVKGIDFVGVLHLDLKGAINKNLAIFDYFPNLKSTSKPPRIKRPVI